MKEIQKVVNFLSKKKKILVSFKNNNAIFSVTVEIVADMSVLNFLFFL